VQCAAERFGELMECDKPETARKVAVALLREGLQYGENPDDVADDEMWEDSE